MKGAYPRGTRFANLKCPVCEKTKTMPVGASMCGACCEEKEIRRNRRARSLRLTESGGEA